MSTSIEKLLLVERASRPAECQAHGGYDSKNVLGSIWSACPTCSSEQAAKDDADEKIRASSERLHAWQRKVGDAGIPERFRDRALDSFVAKTEPQKRALNFAKSYADGFEQVALSGRCAVFCGKPGTGKTHLAVGIGLQIMGREKRTVLFTTVMRALRRVKDTWGRKSSETELQAIAALVSPDLLILDEVGVQFGSETEKLILFDVINERYEKRRPTLLISNLTINEVGVFLGERVVDRLREDGGEFVSFDWESHRRSMGTAA